MILLLGASGYLGRAFAEGLRQASVQFKGLSRQEVDYTSFRALRDFLEKTRPEFLINAAGFTGKPNVDACETARADTLQGNAILPLTISHACQSAGVPWGHVSSGCIFSGAKIFQNGQTRIEPDLTQPELQELIRTRPDAVQGFTEEDEPNFSFRRPPCSFYSGTKALGEEVLRSDPQVYIWRLRIPFDELDDPRNYLTKLQTYPKVYDNFNSISHRGDFVRACLELWQRRAPSGSTISQTLGLLPPDRWSSKSGESSTRGGALSFGPETRSSTPPLPKRHGPTVSWMWANCWPPASSFARRQKR